MSASEKQENFIKSLYGSISEYAPNASEQNQNIVLEKIKPVQTLISKVLAGEEISVSEAKELIDILIPCKDILTPVTECRWKKHNNQWVISGDASVMIPGETVTVKSSKGKQSVVVGTIVETIGNKVYAMPQQETADNSNMADEAGFYYKGDEIIEAYYTKKGFLVARTIVNGKKGEYLGKAGLKNLDRKLSLEEAKAYGRETGTCMVCGKELTVRASIEAGIGPICAAKDFW